MEQEGERPLRREGGAEPSPAGVGVLAMLVWIRRNKRCEADEV